MAKKRKKITTKDGLSRAGWLRQQILFRPTITHQQVLAAYDKSGMPAEERPEDVQALYTAKNGLLKRYGFTSMEDIPRTRTGDLNMAGLVRCFLKLQPEASLADAQDFFALDGLIVSKATFDYARYNQGPVDTTVSPDENQNAGPRAGAETRKKRTKKTRRTKAERLAELKDVAATFEKMERALETLLEEAEHLGKSRLVQKLRDARRAASSAVLDCIG